ncbi:hypothetical protein GGP85_003402, partial [Salinibacter ruber]|nr:hypothetical protein [Salinibacter ruber]
MIILLDKLGCSKPHMLELTRFSGQSTAFTPRQVNEVLRNEDGLVNGT